MLSPEHDVDAAADYLITRHVPGPFAIDLVQPLPKREEEPLLLLP